MTTVRGLVSLFRNFNRWSIKHQETGNVIVTHGMIFLMGLFLVYWGAQYFGLWGHFNPFLLWPLLLVLAWPVGLIALTIPLILFV